MYFLRPNQYPIIVYSSESVIVSIVQWYRVVGSKYVGAANRRTDEVLHDEVHRGLRFRPDGLQHVVPQQISS